MGKPKNEVEHSSYIKDIHFLYEIISSMSGRENLKLFLKDILTKSELRMLKRRWHIANLLFDGYDIRTIANMSRTSTATVMRVKQILEGERGGLLLGIKTFRAKIKQERKDKYPRQGSKFVKNWFR